MSEHSTFTFQFWSAGLHLVVKPNGFSDKEIKLQAINWIQFAYAIVNTFYYTYHWLLGTLCICVTTA